jgi:hypothetical protein
MKSGPIEIRVIGRKSGSTTNLMETTLDYLMARIFGG